MKLIEIKRLLDIGMSRNVLAIWAGHPTELVNYMLDTQKDNAPDIELDTILTNGLETNFNQITYNLSGAIKYWLQCGQRFPEDCSRLIIMYNSKRSLAELGPEDVLIGTY